MPAHKPSKNIRPNQPNATIMNKMKLLFSGLVTLACLSAQASFELLLVADNGSNTVATRKIHRFDSVSGAYLGSFGGFNGTICATYLNQSTNSLFVTTNTGTTEWDYNTGLRKNSFVSSFNSTFRSAVRPSGGRILTFDGFPDFVSNTFPNLSGSSVIASLGSAVYRSGMWLSDTSVVAFEVNQSRFVNITMNATATTGAISGTTTAGVASTGWGQMARNGGTNEVIMAAGNTGNVYSYVPGGSSFTTRTLGLGNAIAAASAHSGYFVASIPASGGAIISSFDGSHNLSSQFGNGIVVSPISMETVLAPEPGSLAALRLGMVALLRRRSR